jgi:hypothetical protein
MMRPTAAVQRSKRERSFDGAIDRKETFAVVREGRAAIELHVVAETRPAL